MEPVAPDPALGHAANFLLHADRRAARPSWPRDFDVALILHADHEMNASTFTARVIASTLSDMHSAITGAIGALKGPLHGGANEQVMHMLQEIGSDESVEQRDPRPARPQGADHGLRPPRLQDHDPRAVILKRYSKALAERRTSRSGSR